MAEEIKGSAETTETFVELLFPGAFYPEEQVFVVLKRNPQEIAKKYPGAFAFQFFDLTSRQVEVDGEKQVVSGKRKNISPMYYPGGKLYSKKDVDKMGPDYRMLRANMNNDGWGTMVKTRCGNWQPFKKGDELL